MKGFKRFKVFYFSNDSRPHLNEPNRNWELIIARNEDEFMEKLKVSSMPLPLKHISKTMESNIRNKLTMVIMLEAFMSLNFRQ